LADAWLLELAKYEKCFKEKWKICGHIYQTGLHVFSKNLFLLYSVSQVQWLHHVQWDTYNLGIEIMGMYNDM
jgi:hypothetical protein